MLLLTYLVENAIKKMWETRCQHQFSSLLWSNSSITQPKHWGKWNRAFILTTFSTNWLELKEKTHYKAANEAALFNPTSFSRRWHASTGRLRMKMYNFTLSNHLLLMYRHLPLAFLLPRSLPQILLSLLTSHLSEIEFHCCVHCLQWVLS